MAIFQTRTTGTTVAVDEVSVVTHFPWLENAVADDRGCNAATRVAHVSATAIAMDIARNANIAAAESTPAFLTHGAGFLVFRLHASADATRAAVAQALR